MHTEVCGAHRGMWTSSTCEWTHFIIPVKTLPPVLNVLPQSRELIHINGAIPGTHSLYIRSCRTMSGTDLLESNMPMRSRQVSGLKWVQFPFTRDMDTCTYSNMYVPSAGKYQQEAVASYHLYTSYTSLVPPVLAETYMKHE